MDEEDKEWHGGIFKRPGHGYDLTVIMEEWDDKKHAKGITIVWILHDPLGYTASDMPFPYSYN